MSLFDKKDSICMPTSSQISPPLKLLMVTSKQLFSQGSLSLYNKDFLQCFVICKPFSEYASLFPERKLTYNKTLYEILIILIGIVEIGRIIN